MIYKVKKGNWHTEVSASDRAAIDAWVVANLGPLEDYEITVIGPDPIAPDPAARLAADMDFGSSLIREFLLDNRNDPNVKTSDSLALLVKFAPAENLLRLGDIRKCRALIDSFTTDTIFTPARKAKYLSMIDTYLTA